MSRSRAVYWAVRSMGALLERSLNRVVGEPGRVLKERRPGVPLRVVNAGLAWLGCGVRFLEGEEWLAWERAVHERTTGAHVEPLPRGLAVTRLPGVPLDRFLAACPAARHEEALARAFAALGRFHAVSIRWPDGRERPLSHADAMAGNVLYDDARGAAVFFDFETVHDPRWSALDRRADDLWSLAYSAARFAPPEVVARALVAGYADAEARRALPGAVARSRPGRLVYHLSQAPLPRDRFVATGAALRAALEEAAA